MMKQTARNLDIVLHSAAGLKRVSRSRMAAYAVAWIEPSLRVPSPLDKRHGRNPVWDTTISIALDERTLLNGKCLHIELLAQGLVSTKPIGFVRVDMAEILLQGSEGAAVRAPFHDHPVTRRSGRQQGILNFELCLQAASAPSALGTVIQDDASYTTPVSSPSAPPLPQYVRESSRHSQPYYEKYLTSTEHNMLSRNHEGVTGYGPNSSRAPIEEISLLENS